MMTSEVMAHAIAISFRTKDFEAGPAAEAMRLKGFLGVALCEQVVHITKMLLIELLTTGRQGQI